MLIVPAFSQWLGLPAATGQSIGWSEVYPLRGLDYATAILTVEQIYGGIASSDRVIGYDTWVSLDGRDFVMGGPGGSSNDVTDASNPPVAISAHVRGAFVRFRYRFEITTASATAGALFTLRVNLAKRSAS